MTSRATRSQDGLSFNQRLAIFERELTVTAITIAEILDRRGATEKDWGRLTIALHRVHALQELR